MIKIENHATGPLLIWLGGLCEFERQKRLWLEEFEKNNKLCT